MRIDDFPPNRNKTKQVIGYVTQYDAWKDIAGVAPKGAYNQLNVDFSKYTILNFSFFGLARDGSLHSADYRNKNIHLPDESQEPADLIHQDVYSSWDKYILFGDQLVLYYISDGSLAHNLGYRNRDEGGWINITTNEFGSFPLTISNPEGPPGLLTKAKQFGVRVMASLGGWSMSKHFPEVARDPLKRKTLVAECRKLIELGFDGIDLDWEFPGGFGMNIIDHGPEDYNNFAVLVEEIRAEIGRHYLITAALSAAPRLLTSFDWKRLQQSMDYFNVMTYDINGGWSNIAGHNSPLYNYPGQEGGEDATSLDKTIQLLLKLGVSPDKINAGVAFYGRGVVTDGDASLNKRTVKATVNVPPDGIISTCGDYVNWPLNVWDGTPNFAIIAHKTKEGEYDGWKYHWDETACVPYLTKDNYFLSYDNERSVALKAKYVVDNDLAGVIIWTAYGDLQNLTGNTTVHSNKLVECHDATSILVNKISEIFDSQVDAPIEDTTVTVNMISPTESDVFFPDIPVKLNAVVRLKNATIERMTFRLNDRTIPADTHATQSDKLEEFYYSAEAAGLESGSHRVHAIVEDRHGVQHSSPLVNFSVSNRPVQPIPTPQVSAVAVTNSYVELKWTVTPSEIPLRFDLYRNDQLIVHNISERQHVDRNVAPGHTYRYFIKASSLVDDQSCSSNTVQVVTPGNVISDGQFPDISNWSVVLGFWHNWLESTYNGSGYKGGRFNNIPLSEIPLAYNVIAVAFMKVEDGSGDHIPNFKPFTGTNDEFRHQIALLHSQRRAVILSLGGADAHIELSLSDEEALTARIISLTDQFGFDGIDIDLEQAAIAAKDNQTVIPAALRRVKDYYRQQGKNFIISMAPEFPYLRTGQSYSPYINGLEGYYDFVAPQYYNQGGDGLWVDGLGNLSQNNDACKEDFLYYLTESIVTGARGYTKVSSEKFLIGLPANNDAAANGYVVDPSSVNRALKRLEKAGHKIKGLMTWSVNWDCGTSKEGNDYNWEFIRRYGWVADNDIPEQVAPSTPVGLQASSITSNSALLTWKPSTSLKPVAIYNLYRNGHVAASVEGTSYTDSGLDADTQYSYQVEAVDTDGNTSPTSPAVIVRTKTDTPTKDEWQSGRWYNDGDIVRFANQTFSCSMQHTSNVYWVPDKAKSLWR